MLLSKILENHTIIGKDCEITGISIDSRKVKEGHLFVCIEGLHVDGHNYAEAAIKSGASAILCRAGFMAEGATMAYSDNIRHSLSAACKAFYNNPAKYQIKVGITGTNGKSTTVAFISDILQKLHKKVATIGTLGVAINGQPLDIPFATSTTPDTIELYEMFAAIEQEGAEYIIMEVTSHALALDKVSHIPFDFGIFTNLSQDHLDFHGNMDNYRLAKAKLFDLSVVGIINGDDDTKSFLLDYAPCPFITYGKGAGNDYQAEGVTLHPKGASFTVKGQGVALPIPGGFNVYNALAAFALCHEVGFSFRDISKAIESLTPVAGRIQAVDNNKGFNVIIDYAHSPDGLKNILEACKGFTTGRVITVFGCGGDRDVQKRPIMGRIAGELSDLCFITSDNPRNEEPLSIISHIEEGIKQTTCKYQAIEDRAAAIQAAIQAAKPNDCVVIAGKGHEDYQEFEQGRRIHFDDAKIAKEALGGE